MSLQGRQMRWCYVLGKYIDRKEKSTFAGIVYLYLYKACNEMKSYKKLIICHDWCSTLYWYSPWSGALWVIFSQAVSFHMVSQDKGFVNRSVIFSVDGMYLNFTCPDLVYSLMKWYLTSICLVLQWFLLLMVLQWTDAMVCLISDIIVLTLLSY